MISHVTVHASYRSELCADFAAVIQLNCRVITPNLLWRPKNMTVLPPTATGHATTHPFRRSSKPFASRSIRTAARGFGQRNSAHNLAFDALPVAAEFKADCYFCALCCPYGLKAERRHGCDAAVAAGGDHRGEAACCPVRVLDKGRP
jgi:hypothetical protein